MPETRLKIKMEELTKKAIERLVFIAKDFYWIEKSEVTLLNESGYFKLYQKIDEDGIIEVLKMHSYLIDDWLRLSRDSRSSERWNFFKSEDGRFFVTHWPEGKAFQEIDTTDEFYACAAFIKRHVESIRILFKK